MGVVAMLALWPGQFEQLFVPQALEAKSEIWLQWA